MRSAIATEAEPWFERFQSESDFVAEYKAREIRFDEPPLEMTGAQRVRAMRYGMYLHDMGNQEDALPWLEAALSAYETEPNLRDYEIDWMASIRSRIR